MDLNFVDRVFRYFRVRRANTATQQVFEENSHLFRDPMCQEIELNH